MRSPRPNDTRPRRLRTLAGYSFSCIAVIAWCLPLLAASTPAGEEVVINRANSSFTVNTRLGCLEDRAGLMDIDAASSAAMLPRYRRADTDVPNFGFTKSVYWFTFVIRNECPLENDFLLEVRYPQLDRIELYTPQPGGGFDQRITGDIYPFNRREIQYNHFVYNLSLARGEAQRFFMRVKTTSSMQVPMMLWSRTAFLEKVNTEQMVYGIAYGMVLVMIIYNLFIFAVVRDSTYILYVLHVITGGMLFFTLNGFSNEFFWQDSTWWGNKCIPFLTDSFALWTTLFTIKMLKTRTHVPLLHRVCMAGVFVSIALHLLCLICSYPLGLLTGLTLAVFLSGALMTTGVLCWRAGYRPARYYVIAIVLLATGVLCHSFLVLGLLPNNVFTANSMQFGLDMEIILFSFALGDRINVERMEKDEAQQRALMNEQLARKAQAEALENLHKADVLKNEFLANTSHELRTPLNGIIGLADSLIDGVAGQMPRKALETLSMIVTSGKRLANLVNDILDYSKLRNKEIELSLKNVDMKTLTDMVIQLALPLVRGKDIRLVNAVDPGAALVLADENRMQQIILNLLGNAIKFTSKGEIVISSRQAGSFVEIAVADTGIGIPADKLEMVFESFEQVDGSISREYGGTGIGLSITKKLVELHGGTIRAASEPGKGSVFTFSIPAVADQGKPLPVSWAPADTVIQLPDSGATAAFTAESRSVEPAAGKRSGGRALVHIVDDDPINLQVLENHLANQDYDVVKSPDGMDALDKIRKGLQPDLVLLDVMMPKLSGYDVSDKLREQFSLYELPIMMLTAKNRVDDMVAGFNHGANDYLTKPFDKMELLARAKTLITLKRAIREKVRLDDIHKEMDVARKILETAIPEGVPALANLDIGVGYIPMETIGGDYYDFHLIDEDKIGILIADACGHGITAALIASMVKIIFSILKPLASSPAQLVSEMNRIFTGSQVDSFLTAAYLYIDYRKRKLEFVRAGHEPLVVYRKRLNDYQKYLPDGCSMGWLIDCKYETASIDIEPGDRIILYTDGVIETWNRDREMFSSKRMMEMVIDLKDLPAKAFAEELLRQLRLWTGGENEFNDDISFVVVDVK